MSDETNHSGTWQAQGDDIPHKGHSVPWDQANCVTKAEGLQFLARLREPCTSSQRDLRENVCRAATRYVQRAPVAGIPGFHMKSFPVKDPPKSSRKARIDLEIIVGRAFCDSSDLKGPR
jgi:hypothetical protein